MKKHKFKFNLYVTILIITTCLFASCNKNNSNTEGINVDSIGIVSFNSFEDAQFETFKDPKHSRPTIKITQKSNNDFMIILLFNSLKEIGEINYSAIKKIVKEGGEKFLNRSIETEIELSELSNNTGYYYNLTDKRGPKPGSFKFMLRGGAIIDKTLITFTLLSKIKNKKYDDYCINVMESLRIQ